MRQSPVSSSKDIRILSSGILFLFAILIQLDFAIGFADAQDSTEISTTVKVFILAGQSNMQGHGVVDLDDEEDYNGGKGTLVQALANKRKRAAFAHLQDDNGDWVERDDVVLRYQTQQGLKKSKLTIGLTGYEGKHHIGPELQFGHVVGNFFDQPVLIIKTAWGGKSLGKDFLPPSAASKRGGETGLFYLKMLDEVEEGLKQVEQEFPNLAGKKLEISGFVWQQGWNDMYDESFLDNYEDNLACLINDLRAHFSVPRLPVVVGELGNGGSTKDQNMLAIRAAERAVAKRPEFRNTVRFAPTAVFSRPAKGSPNVGHLHHWFGNAESYFWVGDSLGNAMLSLHDDRQRVLILGDSISMGYTPLVKKLLAKDYYVTRPAGNCAGTNNGIKEIDRWLEIDGGKWDLIHFNFGLHDLKRVDAQTKKNSNNPTDPNQAPIKIYEKQLREIVSKLKGTGAKLVFATTTPVPAGGVKPHRDVDGPSQYNAVAKKIMEESSITINDLYSFVDSSSKELMLPVNVHFTKEGSEQLADQVREAILNQLPIRKDFSTQ